MLRPYVPIDSSYSPEPEVDTSKDKTTLGKTFRLIKEWNTRQNKKFKSSTLRTIDTSFRPVEAAATVARGVAGTLGVLVTTPYRKMVNTIRGKQTSAQQDLIDIGAPMGASLEIAGKILTEGTMGASESWDQTMNKIDQEYDTSYNAPFRMPKNKAARIAIDVFDPLTNKFIDATSKPVLNTIVGAGKGFIKLKPVNSALYKMTKATQNTIAYQKVAEFTKKAITELQNSKIYNLAIDTEAKYQAAKSYLASSASRGYSASAEQGERRYIELIYGENKSIFTKHMDNYISARDSNDIARLAKEEKYLKNAIPRARENLDELADNYRYTRSLDIEQKRDLFELTYANAAADDVGIAKFYENGTAQNLSAAENIKAAKMRQEQQSIIANVTATGAKDMEAILPNIAKTKNLNEFASIPPLARDAITTMTDKVTDMKWLLRKRPVADIPDEILSTFESIPDWHTMSTQTKLAVAEAMKMVYPHMSGPVLSNDLRKSVMNTIATIPELRNNAIMFRNMQRLLPVAQKMANSGKSAEAMVALKKIAAVDDYIKANKIDNPLLVETFLTNLGTQSPNMAKSIAPILRKAVTDGTEITSIAIKKQLKPALEANYFREHLDDTIDQLDKYIQTQRPSMSAKARGYAVNNVRYILENAKDANEATRMMNSVAKQWAINPLLKGIPVKGFYRQVLKDMKKDMDFINPFIKSIKDKATIQTVDEMFAKGTKGLLGREVNPLWDAARRYSDADILLQRQGVAGAFVDAGTIRTSNAMKEMTIKLALEKGLDPRAVVALGKVVRETDDAFGRFAVRLGMMDNKTYLANQGWHLRKGYELYTVPDLEKYVLPKIDELAATDPKRAEELRTEFGQIMASRATMSYSETKGALGALQEAKKSGVAVLERGGMSTGLFKQRKDMSPELQELFGVYDDIASVHQLTNRIQTKAAATALHYNSLVKMGLASDKSVDGYIKLGLGDKSGTWGPLAGKYVHPWLATRLEHMAAYSEPGIIGKAIEGLMNLWKYSLITSVPTTIRNIIGNAMVIGFEPMMKEAGVTSIDVGLAYARSMKQILDNGGEMFERYGRFSDSLFHQTGINENIMKNMNQIIDVNNMSSNGFSKKILDKASYITHLWNKTFSFAEQTSKLAVADLLTQINPKTGKAFFTDQQAVLAAEKMLIDYADVPPIVDAIRRYSPSFITYPLKMAGNLVKWAYDNPGQQVKVYNRIFQFNRDMTPDYNKEIKLLPDTRQNKLLLRIGGAENKKPIYMDLTYFFPHSIFTVNDLDVANDPIQTTAAKVFMNYFGAAFERLQDASLNKDEYGRTIIEGKPFSQEGATSAFLNFMIELPSFRQAVNMIENARGIPQGKKKQPQSWWYPMLGVRQFDINEEARVKYASTQNQLKRINSERLALMRQLHSGSLRVQNTGTRLVDAIKAREVKAIELNKKLHEISRDFFTIKQLRTHLESLNVPKEDANAYIQSIIHNDNDPYAFDNYMRAIDAARSGNIMGAINPAILNNVSNMNIVPQGQITQQIKASGGESLQVNTGAMGKANREITSGGYSEFPTRK